MDEEKRIATRPEGPRNNKKDGPEDPAPTAPEAFQGSGEEFYALAPKMTPEDLDALNGMFRAFVFRRTKTREYWTTCCRKHVKLDRERTVTAEMEAVFDVASTPEPKCFWGWSEQNVRASERIKCPHCGHEATVKELGRTGRRENLSDYVRAAAFHWHDGALWAVGYNAKKTYNAAGPMEGLNRLTLPPTWTATAAIRFRPGMAEMTARDWWYGGGEWHALTVQTGPRTKNKPFPAGDPFTYCHDYGMSYGVIGREEIVKSPFRYMRLEEIEKETGEEPLRLLAMGCFYARQMEMLHKFGLDEVIKAYAGRGVKTAWLFDWTAEDPKKFLKLPLKTVTEALELDPKQTVNGRIRPPKDLMIRMDALKIWKQRKGRDSLEDCVWEASELNNKWQRDRVRKRMTALGLSLERVRNYLQKQQKARQSVSDVEQLWTDYLDAAEHLGLDLENEVIHFPRDLKQAHDKRCGAWSRILERERKQREAEQRARWEAAEADRQKKEAKRHAEAMKKAEGTLKAWALKYPFSWGGLRIVLPATAQEIIDEGKALKHCVGGYADRHLEGVTTILFLRREDQPDRHLVTVEMSGNELRQAHGWRNEMEPCEDNPKAKKPTELYKEFFDCWVDWLKRGSPRDKDGKPKVGKQFRAKEHADGRVPSLQDKRRAG